MKLHESITLDRVLEIAEASLTDLRNPGICKACGEDQDGCEPDARNYTCEACGAAEVFGAEELMLEIS